MRDSERRTECGDSARCESPMTRWPPADGQPDATSASAPVTLGRLAKRWRFLMCLRAGLDKMARLEAARLQDYRGLRTEGVPSHKAVRLGGRMFVKETGHGSISHSVRRSGRSQGQH